MYPFIICDDLPPFLKTLFNNLASAGIDVSAMEMDHVAFTPATAARYEELKAKLGECADLIDEKTIRGRDIAKYMLRAPFEINGRKIELIELPAPKQGVVTAEGWDHAEFVIGESFETFMARHPHISFNTPNIEFSPENINPVISVTFPDKAKPVTVKFHHHTLERIVEIEKSLQRGYPLDSFLPELMPTFE